VHLTPEQADIQKNKGMAVLSYILFFIPLLTGTHKESPYVKFHVNQGTALWIFSIAVYIVWNILAGILTGIFATQAINVSVSQWGQVFSPSPIWGILLTMLGVLSVIVNLVPMVFLIVGVINSATGKWKKLPLVGKFNIIK